MARAYSSRAASRGMTRAVAAIALAVSCALSVSPTSAWADGKRDLEDGIAFYENLDADRAEQRLTAALGASDLSKRDRARAAMYLGLVHSENGKESAADKAWRQAFALDGSVEAPRGTSPKLVAAIDKVRRTAKRGVADDDVPPPKKVRAADTPAGPSARDLIPAKVDTPRADAKPDKPDAKGEGAKPVGARAEGPKVETRPSPQPRLDPAPPVRPPPVAAPATSAPPVVAERGADDGFPWLWVGVGAAVVGGAVLGIVLASSGGGCADGGCVRVRIGEAP
jgi:hypothetical protein